MVSGKPQLQVSYRGIGLLFYYVYSLSCIGRILFYLPVKLLLLIKFSLSLTTKAYELGEIFVMDEIILTD